MAAFLQVRESGLVQRVRSRWAHLGLTSGSLVVAGYSGGADSLALLGALAVLQRQSMLQVRAVHVDHRSGEASALAVEVARQVCDELGVALDVVAIPDDVRGRHPGVGLEEAWRRERYLAIADVAGRAGAEVVATAHHERDQAETVLLHLMRGAGLDGAVGMREFAEMAIPWWESSVEARLVQLWRPLLPEAFEDVRSFAVSLGVPFFDDPSNEDRRFLRNAVRHDVLPVLERARAGSIANLARFGRLADEDLRALDAITAAELARVRKGDWLDRRLLGALPIAIRRRVVRAWLIDLVPVVLELSAERVEAVLEVAAVAGSERMVEIGGGVSVRVTREWLVVAGVGDQPFT